MTHTTTLSTIKKLEERYPFNQEELEVIARCHEQLEQIEHSDDFLMTLAKGLPYSVFFLPGDELRDRVNWVEDHILPLGFSSRLRCAISTDSFVDYANQGQDKSLERLVEGIADTGRRGSKEALRVTFDILDEEDATPELLVELCVCLAIAAEALVAPNLNRGMALKRLQEAKPCILSMARSLTLFCKGKGAQVNKRAFVEWAEENFPGLASCLSTFVHNLLFHGHPYPKTRVPYSSAKIYESSSILETEKSPLLLALSFASSKLGGKWHRLYSSGGDGRCFNRLEWSLLGYTGPTVALIKTESNAVLGAFTTMPWKESQEFFGDSESFLFQLKPELSLFRSEGDEKNFAYLHTTSKSTLSPGESAGTLCGLGFGYGGTSEPRLFIPESLEGCSAGWFDKTYRTGDLVPKNELERFEIAVVELWGVGGDEAIKKALRDQAEYRERQENFLLNARVVHDKTQFVKDFESGLIANSLYEHKRHSRGRHDFAVDDKHGGYKIERK